MTETTASEIEFTVRSTTKDDRRNKTYHRELSIHISMPNDKDEDNLPYRLDKDTPVTRVSGALHNLVPKPYKVDCYGSKWDDQASYHVAYRFAADKPSEIITEEEALRKLDEQAKALVDLHGDTPKPGEVWQVAVAKVIKATQANHAKIRQTVTEQQQAIRVGKWIAKEADDKARKAVRFKQRLAALEAELKAEQEVQLAAALEAGGQLDTGMAKHQVKAADDIEGYDVIEQRVIEIARKHANRFMPAIQRGPFRTDSQDAITLAEVHEFEEKSS